MLSTDEVCNVHHRLTLYTGHLFLCQLWTRSLKRSETTGETIGYLSPRDDLNAPDMYIPVMAFVSYVLLVGISAGTENKYEFPFSVSDRSNWMERRVFR